MALRWTRREATPPRAEFGGVESAGYSGPRCWGLVITEQANSR